MRSYIYTTDPALLAKVRRNNVLNVAANVAGSLGMAAFTALVYVAWTGGPRWQVATAVAGFVVFGAFGGWAFDTCARWAAEIRETAAEQNTADVHSPVDDVIA